MSNDPEQEFFSDGITEDIITDSSQMAETPGTGEIVIAEAMRRRAVFPAGFHVRLWPKAESDRYDCLVGDRRIS